MADLYINSNLIQKDFKDTDQYTFTDVMGGSTNIVELKDGSNIIDKHQFTLKTPNARFALMLTTLESDGATKKSISISSTFSAGNEVNIEIPNSDSDIYMLSFVRVKYALTDGMSISTDELEDFQNYLIKDGKPTDKLIQYANTSYSAAIDGKNISLQKNTIEIDLSLMPKDTFESNEAYANAAGEIGVSKQIVISNVLATDLTEPQDFTINLKWV